MAYSLHLSYLQLYKVIFTKSTNLTYFVNTILVLCLVINLGVLYLVFFYD